MNVIRKKAEKKEELKSGNQTPIIGVPVMNGSPGIDLGYGSAVKRDPVADYTNQYGGGNVQQSNTMGSGPANRGTVAAIASKQQTQQ